MRRQVFSSEGLCCCASTGIVEIAYFDKCFPHSRPPVSLFYASTSFSSEALCCCASTGIVEIACFDKCFPHSRPPVSYFNLLQQSFFFGGTLLLRKHGNSRDCL